MGAGLGGVVVAPSSLLWVLASACLPLDCGGLCSVGWIGLVWAGSLLIGLAWGPPWEGLWESRRGTPCLWGPPSASGWVLVQLVFQSVGSFLVGGDDWGGLSFPYWVFLPPA